MAENENEEGLTAAAAAAAPEVAPEQNGEGQAAPEVATEEITYHAVEKDGQVTAIWEMQGRKHLRTIDPRSRQGQDILRLYTAEHHDEASAPEGAGGSESAS
jgi:hypothetical protein